MRRTGAWRFICADHCVLPRRYAPPAELDGPPFSAAHRAAPTPRQKLRELSYSVPSARRRYSSERPKESEKVRRGWRAVKRSLDPEFKRGAGVIFGER